MDIHANNPFSLHYDKGQLGNGSNLQVNLPIEIFSDKKIKSVQCGSESTMVIDMEGWYYKCDYSICVI